MNDLKSNKAFRVLCGSFVIYMLFRLWRDGWLSWVFSGQSDEGFGNADLVLAIGAMLINFLELVGIAAIAIVSGILPEVSKVSDYLSEQIKKLSQQYQAGKDKDDPAFDWRPLLIVVVVWLFVSSGRASILIEKVKSLIGIERVIDEDSSRAIMYLSHDASADEKTIANSAAIADLFEDAKIERRLYYQGQDIDDAEPWVADYLRSADPQRSSLIIADADGSVTIRSLPTDLDFYQSSLK